MISNLIHLLRQNALASPEELARQLGTTPEDVQAHIERLKAEGILLGFTAIINQDKWAPDTVIAVIEVKVQPERDGGFDRIAERISRFEEVISCYLVSGGYDLMVVVQGRHLREVAAFVAEKLSTIAGVQSTATRFRLKTYKENGALHAVEPAAERLPVTP